MIKPIILTAIMSALVVPAFADVPPAPPTAVYVEPMITTCEPVTLRIYFQNGEAMLSSHARSVIEEAQSQLEACAIRDVDMVAVSLDGRTDGERQNIGAERLAMVASALQNEGLLPVAASARIAVSGQALQAGLARRVDITLAAYDPKIG